MLVLSGKNGFFRKMLAGSFRMSHYKILDAAFAYVLCAEADLYLPKKQLSNQRSLSQTMMPALSHES